MMALVSRVCGCGRPRVTGSTDKALGSGRPSISHLCCCCCHCFHQLSLMETVGFNETSPSSIRVCNA